MKSAFTHWNNRIAPVFDTARQIRVVESDAGRIVAESEEILDDGLTARKAVCLAQLGIATLICGAISRPLHEMVVSNGIQVIPFVAGELNEVIRAWLGGKLAEDTFAMPGCCASVRGYYQGPYRTAERENRMNRGKGGGVSGGQGRMGGTMAGSGTGSCVCTKCGHREAHERGVPCLQKRCPKCGAALTRE